MRLLRFSFFTIGLITIIATSLSLLNTNTAHAAFDSNNIIDNTIFDNSQTMSANDIQNFLNGFPNSCLANYKTPYPTSYASYGASVSAATAIRRAADLWGINPQVILTTLEKEESLVTGGAGCADWQYNSAMGMGCPDSGACPAPQYAGFSQQVTKGSWQLMFNRERAEGNTSWDGDGDVWYGGYMTAGNRARTQGGTSAYYDGYANIDGTSVYLTNGATASLYTYTPHFHGNQNFVTIFERWFGTTHGTFLLQSPSSPAVYLQSGTTRYGIPSYDVLKAYGFANVKVTPVSDQYMQSLTDGGTLGFTFQEEGQSGVIYFADNGYRFGFVTYAQCTNWGYSDCLTSSSKTLSPYIFNQIHNAGDMKSLMLHGSSVYLMDNGNKREYLSSQALFENGYTINDIVPVTSDVSSQKPYGYSIPENNSFVSFGSTSIIYIYANGNFYPINSYDTFRALLPPNTPVFKDSNSLYNTQPPAQQKAVSTILSTQSGAKEYLFSNGNRYDISSVASDWPAAQAFDEINTVLARKQDAAVVGPNSTFQTPEGYIFRVSNQTVLPFYNLTDFFSSSYAKAPITINQSTINGLPTGNPLITPGGGSLFKVSTSGKTDAIYTMNQDGSSCNLASLSQLGDFRFNTANVQRVSEFMPAGPALTGLVKGSSGTYYIVSSSTKTPLSAQTLTAWGITTSTPVCTFSDNFLNSLWTVQTNKSFTFARTPNGQIFFTNNNVLHPIRSYNTFIGLGGNSNNTIDVSGDLPTYATIGTIYN